MTAFEIIARARADGVRLQAVGDKLKYVGPPDAVRTLLPLLAASKVDLLTALHAEHAEALRENFEERSAIMEFDGGMSRDDAERAAWTLVTAQSANSGSVSAEQGAEIAKLSEPEFQAAIENPPPRQADVTLPEPEPEEDFGPSEEELREAEAEARLEQEAIQRIIDSDDRIAASVAELKRVRAENVLLKSRIEGMLNEKNELVKAGTRWQRKFLKAEKELKQLTPTEEF